ncbi:MAG: glycosyltransferase [Chloroflexi bacterium]|nr:glycosyltransferase [Chloroflexota bacterium]
MARYDALHLRLIQQKRLSTDEQYEWVDQSAHSPELYAYIETQGRTFDFLIFGPYLFGTTYYGSAIYPDRSILWPHLHDEIYAYLNPTRTMYHGCLGVMFNTYPESRLAQRLYGAHPGAYVVGELVDFGLSAQADPGRFREQAAIRPPFVLYAGRLEGGKNVPLLTRYFQEYKRRRGGPLKLVLMGSGPEAIPAHPDIVNLGFVPEETKWDAYAAATLVCQPSVNESFSITVMEAWLSGVPVLVHADCEVTRYHVTQSGGGLYFRDYEDFQSVVDLLLADESLRRCLGMNGNRYVHAHYGGEVVMQNLEAACQQWAALRTTR